MNTKFNELVTHLQINQGSNLVSIIVHGSAIAVPDNHQRSDYHVLIVTNRLSAGDLRQIRPVIQWWTSAGYSLPVFFTAREFNDSLDVYPIEFRHMKHAYRVLYGQDLLADKEVSRDSLRWQIEYELRGKLLRLRSLYLPASVSRQDLTKLMTESIVSFIQFMRPILEILGEEPPIGRLATVELIGKRLNLDLSPLVRILHLRKESKELMEIEVQDLFSSYLDRLSDVIEAVDRM